MTDRELLELAAKAVGLDKRNFKMTQDGEHGTYENPDGLWSFWNPLSDKANCLQMEIDLELEIIRMYDEWRVISSKNGCNCIGIDKDRQRASTMAAAEIGKNV